MLVDWLQSIYRTRPAPSSKFPSATSKFRGTMSAIRSKDNFSSVHRLEVVSRDVRVAGLTAQDIQDLTQLLSDNKHILDLSLRSCRLNVEHPQIHVGDLLKNNPHLEVVEVAANEFRGHELNTLLRNLMEYLPKLRAFHTVAFESELSYFPEIRDDFKYTGPRGVDINTLKHLIINHPTLQVLDLSQVKIDTRSDENKNAFIDLASTYRDMAPLHVDPKVYKGLATIILAGENEKPVVFNLACLLTNEAIDEKFKEASQPKTSSDRSYKC